MRTRPLAVGSLPVPNGWLRFYFPWRTKAGTTPHELVEVEAWDARDAGGGRPFKKLEIVAFHSDDDEVGQARRGRQFWARLGPGGPQLANRRPFAAGTYGRASWAPRVRMSLGWTILMMAMQALVEGDLAVSVVVLAVVAV